MPQVPMAIMSVVNVLVPVLQALTAEQLLLCGLTGVAAVGLHQPSGEPLADSVALVPKPRKLTQMLREALVRKWKYCSYVLTSCI